MMNAYSSQMYTNLLHINGVIILFYFMNFLIIGKRQLMLQHRFPSFVITVNANSFDHLAM